MTLLFHTTIYCCPACGTDFEFTEWENEDKTPLTHEPTLCCPKCEKTAFRVSREERSRMKEYVHLKTEVLTIIFERFAEVEERMI